MFIRTHVEICKFSETFHTSLLFTMADARLIFKMAATLPSVESAAYKYIDSIPDAHLTNADIPDSSNAHIVHADNDFKLVAHLQVRKSRMITHDGGTDYARSTVFSQRGAGI